MDGVDPRDRQKRDFDDLQNEIAGRDVPRRARFMPGSEHTSEIERKKREERAFRNYLEQLLADPIYRAKYDGVMDALRKAERATQTALDQIAQAIELAQIAVEDMEDRAARLPDGTAVFKDEDGNVRRADGSIVEDHLVETILWSGEEPSYEEYQAQRERLETLTQDEVEVERYRDDVLGSARDKLTDGDNPQDIEGLDDIHRNIIDGMPEAVSERYEVAAETDVKPVATADIALPSLSGN